MRVCPLCKSNKFTPIADLNYLLFDDLNLSGQMLLAQCSHCYFIYNRTCLLENDFSIYYRANECYFESTSPGTGGLSDRDIKRYARIYNQASSFLQVKKPFVLDFGSGKGGLLRWLKKNSQAIIAGVEASNVCRQYILDTLCVPVYEKLSKIKEQFDIVILSHVLEHMYFPADVLKQLHGFLNASAVVYIEVPQAESYLYPAINWRELYFEHINHFSSQSLTDLFVSSGFEILETGTRHFYEDDVSTAKCRFCIVRAQKEKKRAHSRNFPDTPGTINVDKLPGGPVVKDILKNRTRISIWGISQYTQLVLGTYPELLNQIDYFFDGSAAKMGRSLGHVQVRSSKEINKLGSADMLLIPVSSYMKEMADFLQEINFEGQVVFF